mmetsp:Transcript_5254/g.7730  ORF Transcript_5254/g.7730 Transcript_5254/m.7730 type:complete len:192 (+) Transcript_5254:95-670(+)
MELSHIGRHCDHKECRQLDFLPFKCSHCKQSFCLKHFKPGDHNCTKYTPPRPPVVTVCKDCNRSILKDGELSIAELLKKHYRAGECKKFKVYKPHRCSYIRPSGRRCKKREFDENICKLCKQNFCLKHRHPEDHKCEVLEKKKKDDAERKLNESKHSGRNSRDRVPPKGRRVTNLAHSRLVKAFTSIKVQS